MFHSKPDVAGPAAPPSEAQLPLIPLSVLALDLDVPVEGWSAFLNSRGIEIVTDDLGRASVARDAARRLFTERREAEAKAREHAAAAELQAIERDRQFRASLGRGIPADALAGMTYGEAVASAGLDGQTYRPRASVAEDLLDSGGGLVFHSFGPAPDEDQ